MESPTTASKTPLSVRHSVSNIEDNSEVKNRRSSSLPRRLMSLSFKSSNKKNLEEKYLLKSETHSDVSLIKYISQSEAIKIDEELFSDYGFSVDQLMELAGLSVATAIAKTYPPLNNESTSVLVCCGPGNNGGDGLVAARHLKLFGFKPTIFYPKPGSSQLFKNLVKQCQEFELHFLSYLPQETHLISDSYNLIVDAIFGFSYKPPLRPQFAEILTKMVEVGAMGVPIISVDIPSGWNVEEGPPKDDTPVLKPECLISLTAPKKCAQYFSGRFHWLGGRFVPSSLAQNYKLNLPLYSGTEQCLLLHKND